MANYEKPVIIDTEEHYEGVYAASGDNTDSGVSAPKCDSKYMNGVWHAPDYNNMMRLTGAMSVCANT